MPSVGIELIARNSLNSLRHASQTSNYLRDTLDSQPVDDRSWSWGYLRRQFKNKSLDELYSSYQRRLQHGYFSVFLLLQIVVSLGHISAVVALDGLVHSVPDVACYALVLLLCVPLAWVLLQEKAVDDYPCVPFASSCAVVAVMVAADLALTIYHSAAEEAPPPSVRPSFTTHSLLACYMFLPLGDDVQALILGATISACHLVTLGTVVYQHQPRLTLKLLSDAVYLTCANFYGMYFRWLNEISLRRTFLDRRACMEATHKLEYEKRQEEHLLLSILPRHIVENVRDDIRKIIQQIDNPPRKKPFSDMYVNEHANVSILYADVVNYSQLTVSLPVQKLVEVLNELFGRFDDACKEHDVLRIKFLGDCYNCVSGIPTMNPSHAKNCVRLGLDMIFIIKEVREARNLNDRLNMRIGVHSGKVLSGLLGVCKWQYDIWSQDAIIANHMEQAGTPGYVHVTKDTLSLLDNEFQYKPAHGNKRNKFLEMHNIETFLILTNQSQLQGKIEKQQKRSNTQNYDEKAPSFSRRISNGNARRLTGSRIHNHRISNTDMSSPIISRRRMAVMDNNLIQYQQTLRIADKHMAEAIKNMPVGVYHRWMFHQTKINPLFLNFKKVKWEMPFLRQPDPLFKFYIVSSLTGVVSMMLIQALGRTSHWLPWVGLCTVTACLVVLLPLTWSHYVWNKLKDPHEDQDVIDKPRGILLRVLHYSSLRIMWRYELRYLIYVLLCTLLLICALMELVECGMDMDMSISTNNVISTVNVTVLGESHWVEQCLAPWNITESCMLVMMAAFLFLRIHFLLKLLVSVVIFTVYACAIWFVNPQLFTYGETMNPGMKPVIAHTLCILFLGTTLHMLDRQTEYINRLDYKWKRQLLKEKHESEITHMVNKMLLENILPVHVAKLYLNTNRSYGQLYHEEYETVAVMFATITDYALVSEYESEGFDQRKSLMLLNEIIRDFDELLFEPSFLRVEKIKMADWTYMAACGLDSGRRDSAASVSAASFDSSEHVAVVMARFAAMMMNVLNENNRDTIQNFRLRVGICHGEVTAGVVGSHKPLYDIWGDAVNMASRMDSTGEPGKIQVTEETAMVLKSHGVSCQCRGLTYVKGKGDTMTYFVDIDDDFRLVNSKTPVRKSLYATVEENTRL